MAMPLDVSHQQNLRWILQVLGLSRLMPGSVPALGIAPSIPIRPQPIPLKTVAYGSKPHLDSLMASSSESIVEVEVANFAPIAYGAALGLIYYRALGDMARAAWDSKIQRVIDETREQMKDVLNAGRRNWQAAAQNGGSNPAFQKSLQDLGTQREALSRKLDFFISLQSAKEAVFSGPRFKDFNDDSVVGRTPWCQCDAEFRFSAWQMLSGEAKGPPVFNRGWDNERPEKTLKQEVSDAFNTILKAKATHYLDLFLELGEPVLKGALREGFELIIRHIPVADLVIDWIQDKLAEMRISGLINLYRQDEQRRFYLKSLDWGTYTRLGAVGTPTGGVPRGEAGRGQPAGRGR